MLLEAIRLTVPHFDLEFFFYICKAAGVASFFEQIVRLAVQRSALLVFTHSVPALRHDSQQAGQRLAISIIQAKPLSSSGWGCRMTGITPS